jgi:predicted glycosyltransferase involved in capsule biosynthesis
VKQCRLSKHLKTDRHSNKEKLKKEEEKKQKYMEEYLKDDETRIAKLKQIWKTITQKTLKTLTP